MPAIIGRGKLNLGELRQKVGTLFRRSPKCERPNLQGENTPFFTQAESAATSQIMEDSLNINPQMLENEPAKAKKELREIRELVSENEVELIPMDNEAEFINRVQEAFQKDYEDVHGPWNLTVLPTEDVYRSLESPGAQTYFAKVNGKIVGGTSVAINPETQVNDLNLLYVNTDCQSKGIGEKIWKAIEEKFPETKAWECFTPHYSVRNINFYLNKCGFKIKNFFNKYHQLPGVIDNPGNMGAPGWNFFEFEKIMNK